MYKQLVFKQDLRKKLYDDCTTCDERATAIVFTICRYGHSSSELVCEIKIKELQTYEEYHACGYCAGGNNTDIAIVINRYEDENE
jgi:hypothetical protein